jgi:transcriptional regulator with XRE-family HTH domain
MTKDYGKPNHFKAWRKYSGLDLREAATALGLSGVGELSDIEHTRRPASTELIIKMIQIYKVKILSVRQPWANWIVNGHKTVEVRTWKRSYRGNILIHASGKPDKRILDFQCGSLWSQLNFDTEPRGSIVGMAKLVDIKPYFMRLDFQRDRKKHFNPLSFYQENLWGWVLEDAKKLPEPIPVNGKLGLWEWKG